MRPVVVLDAQDDLAALRTVAHMEAGHQVVLENCPVPGGVEACPWWPATERTVHALMWGHEQ